MGACFLPARGLSVELRMLRLEGCCGTSYASIVPCKVILSRSTEWMITRTGQWSWLSFDDICRGKLDEECRLLLNDTTRVDPGGWSKPAIALLLGGRKLGLICSTRDAVEVGPWCARLVLLKLAAC